MTVKKISMICDSLGGGGAEAVMTTLCTLFTERGLEVEFIVTKAEGVYLEKVKSVAKLTEIKARSRYLIPKLYSHLRKTKPDILFSTQSHINISAIVASKLANIKCIVREATTPSIAFKNNGSKLGLALRMTYNFADKIVSVSDGVKEDLVNNFSIKKSLIETVYNPIITEDFYRKAKQKVNHPWFDLGIPVIVSVGRFAKAKDYPTLIKAFDLIRNEIPSKLLILGDTDSDLSVKKNVTSLIDSLGLSKDIDLIGFQKNPFPYVKNSSLYILSSIFEGLPGALIQAVALGCKVVSTNCESGPKEILNNGELGVLVPIKDYKAIANEACRLLKDKSQIQEVPESFFHRFSLDGVYNQYHDLFDSVIRI